MDAPKDSQSSRSQGAENRLKLRGYLSVLSTLSGRFVVEEELMSLSSTQSLSEKLRIQPPDGCVKATVPFSALRLASFREFLAQLSALSRTPVVIWVDGALACGALAVGSFCQISFDFVFGAIPGGVLVISSSDGTDSMLLDFECTAQGDRIVQIELRGATWSNVALAHIVG